MNDCRVNLWGETLVLKVLQKVTEALLQVGNAQRLWIIATEKSAKKASWSLGVAKSGLEPAEC